MKTNITEEMGFRQRVVKYALNIIIMPNQHTQEELDLIRYKHHYHRQEGSTQVYRKLRDAGYTRTYDSMCIQIRKMKLNVVKENKSHPKSNYKKIQSKISWRRCANRR